MSTRNLILSERNGKLSRFVDPALPEHVFQHNVENLRRNVGKDRVKVVRNTFVQEYAYAYTPCGEAACSGQIIQDTAKLILSGASQAEVKLAWESLKANVDKALETYNVGNGIPLPIDAQFSVIIPEIVTEP